MPEARRGAARQSLHSVLYSSPAWSPEQPKPNASPAALPPRRDIHPRFAQERARTRTHRAIEFIRRSGGTCARSAPQQNRARFRQGRKRILPCGLFAGFRLGQLHRQQPGDPQGDKVERQKGQQARLRPNALDHETDEIVGDVAERHEPDVVEDELHDALSRTGIAPALVLAQAAADESLFCSIDLRLPSHGLRSLRPRGSQSYSSNFRLAALTTSAKTLMSPSIFWRNSSAGPPPGLTAIALSFSRTPPSASARRNSVSSLWAIAGGVPAETNTPLQRPIFTSG